MARRNTFSHLSTTSNSFPPPCLPYTNISATEHGPRPRTPSVPKSLTIQGMVGCLPRDNFPLFQSSTEEGEVNKFLFFKEWFTVDAQSKVNRNIVS